VSNDAESGRMTGTSVVGAHSSPPALGSWLDKHEYAGGIGLTQLEWAPGAAQAFTARGMPYVMFVRDDTVFRLEERFRPVMEGAALVCAAGEGLLGDIRSRFAIQQGHSVPLPIDFCGRFGSMDDVNKLRTQEQAKRPDRAPPHNRHHGRDPREGFADVPAPSAKVA